MQLLQISIKCAFDLMNLNGISKDSSLNSIPLRFFTKRNEIKFTLSFKFSYH